MSSNTKYKYSNDNHLTNYLPPRTTLPRLAAFLNKEKKTLKIKKLCVYNFATCKDTTDVTPDSGRAKKFCRNRKTAPIREIHRA